jgi:hypothetical protein
MILLAAKGEEFGRIIGSAVGPAITWTLTRRYCSGMSEPLNFVSGQIRREPGYRDFSGGYAGKTLRNKNGSERA